MSWKVYQGDVLSVLRTLESDSVDSVVSDPPYAEVDRPYGRWTEEEWFALMKPVVREVRRILKPHGSAVFIIQPNSERIGRLRPWVFDFVSWCCREWNVVQDAYWESSSAPPLVHAQEQHGLLRGALKPCVWIGDPDCYRNQGAVLQAVSGATLARYASAERNGENGRSRSPSPSGVTRNFHALAATLERRGGVVPINVLHYANSDCATSAGAHGHGAGTPLPLCRWWVRYLTKPGGVVLDTFAGTATVGIAAVTEGFDFVGIERDAGYCQIARRRLSRAAAQGLLGLEV